MHQDHLEENNANVHLWQDKYHTKWLTHCVHCHGRRHKVPQELGFPARMKNNKRDGIEGHVYNEYQRTLPSLFS